MTWMNQLIIAPILLPLLTAALMLMLGEKHRPLKARINLFSSMVGRGIAVLLLYWTQKGGPGSIGVYLPGNWQVPFGIVLVLDKLSAMMVALTALLAVIVQLYAISTGWDARGKHFHALFQFQLMGICGAFLTGDAFNLFVFFEVGVVNLAEGKVDDASDSGQALDEITPVTFLDGFGLESFDVLVAGFVAGNGFERGLVRSVRTHTRW